MKRLSYHQSVHIGRMRSDDQVLCRFPLCRRHSDHIPELILIETIRGWLVFLIFQKLHTSVDSVQWDVVSFERIRIGFSEQMPTPIILL